MQMPANPLKMNQKGQALIPLGFAGIVFLFFLAVVIAGVAIIAKFALYSAAGLLVGFLIRLITGQASKAVAKSQGFKRNR